MNLFSGFGGKKGYEEDRAKEEASNSRDRDAAYERDRYDREADRDARIAKFQRDTKEERDTLKDTYAKKDSDYYLGKKEEQYAKVQNITTSEPWQQEALRKEADKKAERAQKIYKEQDRKIDDASLTILATEGAARDRDKAYNVRRDRERAVDYTRDADVRKHIAQKKYDYKIEKMKQQDKSTAERERKYGPSRFDIPVSIGGVKIDLGGALGGISQYRNFQQTQELKKLKDRRLRETEKSKLYGIQQSRGIPPQSQSMGGFGQPLSMGGGMGMGLGPSNQQRYDESGQPINRDPMSMPNMGLGMGLGMGSNPFSAQRREPVQEAPRREFTPARVIRKAPRGEVYAPGTGQESEQGALYIREMESYGPKYTRVSPEEIMEGETLFKKVKTNYGYKYIKLRR